MPFMANCASTCVNHSCGSFGQKGGSLRETLVTAAGGGAGTGCPSVAWGLDAVGWGGVFETAPEPRGRPRPTEAGGRTGVDIVKHGKIGVTNRPYAHCTDARNPV